MKLLLCFVISILASSLLCMGTTVEKSKENALYREDLDEYVIIDNKTYYFGITAENYSTFYEAQERCEELGLVLISLQTKEKSDTIFNWIFENPDYDRWYWSSGRSDRNSNDWTWTSTDEGFGFTNWGNNQPDRLQEFESCMNFALWFGGWDDDNCETVSTSFMCEEQIP